MDILQGLNEKQQEAVQTVNGAVLIIAGAGSGKTKTLTHRIAYLIQENKAHPLNILAVTFTNKAATEMRERVKNLINGTSRMPLIGTFHSVCARMLRSEAEQIGINRNFLIYDSSDQLSLMKESLKEVGASLDQFNPSSVLSMISSAKNGLETADLFSNRASGYFEEITAKSYHVYQEKLQKANALDFDDLIMKTVLMLRNFPAILEKYQNVFKFVMVDEYQDTNYSQYSLTNLLAKKHSNLCVVGDDWQSIYGWRGADIGNILKFEKDYPQAKIVLLEQNYRSSQEILDASYGIISKNINRKDKRLWSDKKNGAKPIVAQVAGSTDEGLFIINQIQQIIEENRFEEHPLTFNDFAVLYRTNAQSRALEEVFLSAGVSYKIVGGLKFYSRKEIKDILAYLRLVLNPSDKISIARIINVPPRGIGKITLDKFLKNLDSDKKFDGINSSKEEAISSFLDTMDKIRAKMINSSLSELLDFTLTVSGYTDYIQKDKDREERWENIQELFTVVEKFKDKDCETSLKSFLEEVSLLSDSDEVETKNNTVNLMTIHSSKGLEFNTVFMAGMDEGIFPHSLTTRGEPKDLEEERRLCYVGMTRAKERLFLIHAQLRTVYGNTVFLQPSRFLDDIPKDMKNTI